MAFVSIDGTRLYYRLEGNDDCPVLVLSHALSADHGMWAPQLDALLPHFRILRYDTRGHGGSDVPPGEYTIERLGRDALGLADVLRIGTFAFCGLSLGGMIGQWLAIHARERLTQLVLANTSSHMPGGSVWDERRRAVLDQGMSAVVEPTIARWFLPERLSRRDPQIASIREVMRATSPAGYAACAAAIRDMNQTAELKHIRTPTLVIAGDSDPSTPWTGHGDVIAREIPGARVVHLSTAHLSNAEEPEQFNSALLEFLQGTR